MNNDAVTQAAIAQLSKSDWIAGVVRAIQICQELRANSLQKDELPRYKAA